MPKQKNSVKKYVEIYFVFQDQNRNLDQKIKKGLQIVKEQEKIVELKESELESTRSDLKDKTEQIALSEKEVETLEQKVQTLRETTDEMRKKLKTNDSVIQWLNKQLTTAQARDPGLRLGPPPEGIHFSPSSLATSTPMVLKENKRPGNMKKI